MKLTESEKKTLESHDVEALVLFGSQAQGIANEASDYDLFVIGPKKEDSYDIIYDIFEKKINRMVNIDIVFNENAPSEMKNHVAKYGVVLFEKAPSVFADFKQRVMIEYADFAPIRAIFSNATLARI